MFTAFQSLSPSSLQPSSEPMERPAASPKHRPKRVHVQRACNACRLNRVRCDKERPCRNCKHHNRRCVDAPVEIRSLAAATEEIDKLRARIQELEQRSQVISPRDTSEKRPGPPSQKWKGVRIDDVYFGPSSSAYFLDRLYTFLEPVLPGPALFEFIHVPILPPAADPSPLCSLSRSQQDYYLDLYWLWYHPVYPILIEDDFREEYVSLWAKSKFIRSHSPLVDIVLALCIQFSTAYTSSGLDANGYSGKDHLEPGGERYRSCQSLLDSKQDTPSLCTVQCFTLSAIYLFNAGFTNHAQIMIAKAVRTATILGYNQEIVPQETEPVQEATRRVWWTLYILESQIAMDTGRSFITTADASFCHRPSDSRSVARALGRSYDEPNSSITWLTFQNQLLALTSAFRAVHESFFAKCDSVISEIGPDAQDMYGNGPARETCAQFLIDQMKLIRSWVDKVPPALQIQRQSSKPFGANRSPYNLDETAPVWLQRQRVLLELQYHHLCAMIYRSFICFYPNPASGTPLSDCCAISALDHAMAATTLLHQALTETDLLTGWHQAFYLQRNAAMLMGGFACAYPVCPPTVSAKKTGQKAQLVLVLFSGNFGEANEIASCHRELANAAETILVRFKTANLMERPVLPSSEALSLVTPDESTTGRSKDATTPNYISPLVEEMPMHGQLEGQEHASYSLWPGMDGFGANEDWNWASHDPAVATMDVATGTT